MGLNDEIRKKLVEEAVGVRQWAYAPYSNYKVGAALLASSGKIYVGVNVENAAYPSGICAERTACFRAVTEGERQFTAIVIASENGGMPCGSCRQVLSEFGLELVVIIADKDGKILKETSLKDLLPGAFLPGGLQNDKP